MLKVEMEGDRERWGETEMERDTERKHYLCKDQTIPFTYDRKQ